MPGVYHPAPGGAINPPRKLLDQVRDVLRVKHYLYRTEQAYVGWIRRFILFHDKRHPLEMGGPEVERFLTWLPQGSDGRRQPSNPSCGAGLGTSVRMI